MSPERRRVPRISSLLTLRYRLSVAGKPLGPMSLPFGKRINLSKTGIAWNSKSISPGFHNSVMPARL